MKVKNQSKETQAFMIAGNPGRVKRYELKPGDTAEVEDGYCVRRKLPSGKVIPSVVERLTNGRVVPFEAKAKADDDKPKGNGKGKDKPKG